MSNNDTTTNINNSLFNPHVEQDEVRRSKDVLREKLTVDVDLWLAQGNEIYCAPPAFNCPNNRKVNVTDPSYYH